MQFSQSFRRTASSLRRALGKLLDRIAAADPQKLRQWSLRTLLAAVTVVVLYYVIGMIAAEKIDDNLNFSFDEAALPPGASRTVAVAAALINREINEHSWVANDPFFMPSSLLDNMPYFQMGIISALARFSFELTDQIGRRRGSSEADPDLQDASGLLQYSGTRWIWDPSVSIMPTAPAEDQYLKARKSLLSYNARLAKGDAVFERRADNLLATLDRIAKGMGSSSDALAKRLAQKPRIIDAEADNLFYGIKGQMYGYFILLREMEKDFDGVIQEKKLGPLYQEMLSSLGAGASLKPFAVMPARPDGLIFPNHLSAQGFYLLRARTQLRELTDTLLK